MWTKKVLFSGIFTVIAVALALPYVYYMLAYSNPETIILHWPTVAQEILGESVKLAVVVFIACLIGLHWGEELGFAGIGKLEDLRRNWRPVVFFGLLLGVLVYFFGDRHFLKLAPGFYPTQLKFAIFIPFYAALIEEVFARFGVMTLFAKIFRNNHVGNALAAVLFAVGHVNLFQVAGIIYRLNYVTAISFVLNLGISLFFGYIYWKKGLVTAMGIHFIANCRYIVIALLL